MEIIGGEHLLGLEGLIWSSATVLGEVKISLGTVFVLGAIGKSKSCDTKAGLTLSIDTQDGLPLMVIFIVLSDLDRTSCGPVYGCVRGGRTLSTRRKTCVHEDNAGCTKCLEWPCAEVATGFNCRMALRREVMNSSLHGGMIDAFNISLGRRNVVPYTISAHEAFKSSLTADLIPNRTIGSTSVHVELSCALIAVFK